MNIARQILQKKGLRSDTLWTHPLLFRTAARYLPLMLDVYALLRSQYWPREQLDALAETRLRTLFLAATALPLWRERLGSAWKESASIREALASVPVSQKSTYTETDPSAYTSATEAMRSHQDFTSGSTGAPFGYRFGWASELRCFAFCERTFYAIGEGARPPVISMRARHRIGFIFRRHLMFYLAASADIVYRMKDLLNTLSARREPPILYGYTSWIIELAKQLRRTDQTARVRAVVATGEGLTLSDRRMIQEVFKAPFYTTYATRELGWLGFECAERRMHLNEEWGYVEIVDNAGTRLPVGVEGRIVVTTFDNTVMPFIRYDIGDRGAIDATACPCGRTLRTITFSGRQTDTIQLGDNYTLSLLDLSPLFDAYWRAVHQYQIVQHAPLVFTIRVIPGPRFESEREALHERLIRALHPRAQLSFELVAHIEPAKSGKALYFIKAF